MIIPFDHRRHHNAVRTHGIAEDVEQVIARNDEREWESILVARLAGIEAVEPFAEHAVEKAVDAVTGDGALGHDLLSDVGRDGVERSLRVALQLDGTPKELVLLHLLEHLDLHPLALQRQRGDEPGDASASNQHLGQIVARHLRRRRRRCHIARDGCHRRHITLGVRGSRRADTPARASAPAGHAPDGRRHRRGSATSTEGLLTVILDGAT
mmetsp:Transcript_36256/g.90471  ORF Transcript_36256/g.90471 Transcript_36256/m.90471 type:complete len:211 (+) Transcript_36256:1425-2057(+)